MAADSPIPQYRTCFDCFGSGAFIAEVVFFLYKTAESLMEPTVKLWLYQKVCLEEFTIEKEICFHLKDHPLEEVHVQQLSANYIMYYKILLNLPAIMLGLFCGAWSDIVGRKLPMILPCLGAIFACLFYMLGMLPHWFSIGFVLIGAAVNGIFGKSAVISMAVHSYIADVSTKDTRTQKLGKLLSMNFYGLFVGSLLAGIFLDKLAFNEIYCIVVAILAACVVLVLTTLKESVPGIEDDDEPKFQEPGRRYPEKRFLFNPRNVTDSLEVLWKSREGNTRCHLFLVFLTVIANQICKAGEIDITLLFVERYPLSWPKSLYGYLLALDYASLGLSLCFILPFLSVILRMQDSSLVLIGMCFKIGRLIFVAFSNKTWMVFLGVIIGSMSGMIVSGSKSMISKLVDENEIGKIFSLLSCGETLSNLLGAIIFTSLYSSTFLIFPGFTFLIEALIYAIGLGGFVWLAKDIKIAENYKLLQNLTGSKSYGSGIDLNSRELSKVPEEPSQIIDSLSDSSFQSTPTRPIPPTEFPR